ncbi:penicillin-binding protein activator [Paenirhodobacter hankyongi]|uniref:Penicillin-binding protein activator n=1 Tax=Paenirhodobacter hankyongi TaxID=2294033 RepID=A0A421BSY7_9RHOB|nr:penicillin-binding protein activator [Sinirhodobacter hankyongi]RLL71411.1 penicillin-binding protein activator [Sinirhodobacter hankyongi]
MFAKLRSPRNPVLKVGAMLSALWLAACTPGTSGGPAPRLSSGEAVPVALLVPGGSGATGDETLAKSLRQAAELAISDLDGVKIDLRVYNTGGSPAQAAEAATQAVDAGAKIILGPVFAEAANAAGLAVADRGVNVLSFSNNTDIAGGNVFVLGPTFPNTANRLVSYAAAQGKRRILTVSDQTTAGEIGARAIQTAISRSGASNAGQISYPFSQQDVTNVAPQIAAKVQGGGVDALFLTADTAGALPLLAQLLPQQGVDPAQTKFIGLTRWDIPPATLALPGLQGGWFALPDPNLNTRFKARYETAFGSAPHPIAGLAYDGIAAIGALVKSGHADALSRNALTQPAGFVGVNGIFRLRPDGSNERGLAVAEIRNNQVVVIDPAPRSFGGAGF